MEDKFYLNHKIRQIVEDRSNSLGKSVKQIREDADLKPAYFGKLMNYNSYYGRPMNDELAIKILLACEYKLSEAKQILAEIKVKEAIESLPEKSKNVIKNNVFGDHTTINQG